MLDFHSGRWPRRAGSETRARLALVLSALVLLAALLFTRPAPAWAQREPARPARAFADALERFEDRQYALAAEAFAAYRNAYPDALNAPEALYYEATAQLARGHDADAARLFERLQADYPAHPRASEAQLSLGRYFFERGDYAQARTALRRTYARNPASPQAPRALYDAGEAAMEEGDTEAAMDDFRRVADVYPEADVAPDALYALASAQVAREDYDAAARSLETLSARYPEAPYARTLGLALAEVYYELGDYRRTIREVEARMSSLHGEERARAAFLRADSYGQLGDDAEAARAYRAFLDDYPGSPYARPARYGLARTSYRQENYAQAADAFAQVQQSAPSLGGDRPDLTEQAAYYEAASRDLAGDAEAAAGAYAAFLQEYPGSPHAAEAQYELGLLYYGQERYDDAATTLSQLLEERDLDADTRGDALYWRGNALLALGDLDAAMESYDDAVETGSVPASVKEQAAFQRAYALYEDGAYGEAAAAFAAFRRAFPESEHAGDALFWGAESIFQQENFDRAEAGFTQYTNQYAGGPHMNAARYALGWTYFRQQRYEAAAAAFERFLATYPRDTGDVPYREDAQLRLADSYYALKRYDDAIRAYGQIRGENEDYALYQQAQAQSFNGALDAAAGTLQRLLEGFPESDLREEAQYRLGYVYFQQQDYDAAVRAYGRVIDTAAPDDPLAAQAQYGIGDALFNDGRFEDAARAYRTVLERYPDSPAASDAAASIQYALEAMGDDAGATAMIDSFAAANPESGAADELRFRRAEAKYRSGDVDGALVDFRRFVRTSQNEDLLPEAYFYLGSISADRGQTTEAENYLRQVVNTYPESARATSAASRLGRLYREQDRPQEALRLYRAMADLQPDDASVQAEARFGQSMALMSLGQEREAQQLLQETIDAAPDAPEATLARLGLARLYEEAGRSSEAADLYRRVVRASRDEAGAEALYRLGALRLRQGDPNAALEELSRLPDLYSAYPQWLARGYLVQARAYRRLGQRGDAARLYDRVLRDFAGTPFAQTALEEKAAL